MKRLMNPFTWVAALFIAGLSLIVMGASATEPKPTAGSMVKVMLKDGHGSAVAIGNDLFLTAAHVAEGGMAVTLKLDDGRTCKAEALWSAKAYDVAMLRAENCEGVQPANLVCRDMKFGESIVISGNPSIEEFVSGFGRVSTSKRTLGPWKEVQIADVTVVMGQSGGPVFAENGDLVGIVVGVLTVSMGFSSSLTGYGVLVPSSTICGLLARGA